MNCLEFRRILLQNPAAKSEAMLTHLQDCASCKAFAREVRQQEEQLKDALSIPVPPQLAERILLATSLRQRRWQPYALTATILLATMIGVGSYWHPQRQVPSSWSEIVLAHVLNERDALEQDEHISADRLRVALASFGLTLKGELGRIRYLERCEMPGGKGLHVVIDTHELGQVTLIFPPRGIWVDRRQSARDGFAARLLQVGDTTIGIVTEHSEQMGSLSRWLKTELYPSEPT